MKRKLQQQAGSSSHRAPCAASSDERIVWPRHFSSYGQGEKCTYLLADKDGAVPNSAVSQLDHLPRWKAKCASFPLSSSSSRVTAPRRKALKVAELRDALNKASVAFPPKANKTDLVAKVLASHDALVALGFADAKAAGDENDDLVRVVRSAFGDCGTDALAH